MTAAYIPKHFHKRVAEQARPASATGRNHS